MTLLKAVFAILVCLPALFLFFYLYKQLIEAAGSKFGFSGTGKKRGGGRNGRGARYHD